MKKNQLKSIVKRIVDNERLLPDKVRNLIHESITKQQKESFRQIVIEEMTRSINEEIDADYDCWRGW